MVHYKTPVGCQCHSISAVGVPVMLDKCLLTHYPVEYAHVHTYELLPNGVQQKKKKIPAYTYSRVCFFGCVFLLCVCKLAEYFIFLVFYVYILCCKRGTCTPELKRQFNKPFYA